MDLSEEEKRTIAQALRAAAYRAEKDAEAQKNPKVHAIFMAEAQRLLELAKRFEVDQR